MLEEGNLLARIQVSEDREDQRQIYVPVQFNRKHLMVMMTVKMVDRCSKTRRLEQVKENEIFMKSMLL